MENNPNQPANTKLLDSFKQWEVKGESGLTLGADEFQITIPIFNVTMNVVRECSDGTNCTYLTYSDNGQGGIHERFTWDEK